MIHATNALQESAITTLAFFMDDGIREALHAELAPCRPREFWAAYAERADDAAEVLASVGAVVRETAGMWGRMTVDNVDDCWVVTDSAGGTWWPVGAGADEVDASPEPMEAALDMCIERPSFGEWTA